MHTIFTNNFSETQEMGKKLAENAEELQVLALHGDLGAGKTTFVQGFAQALGVAKRIISPTFIIMRTYEILHHSGMQEENGSRDKYVKKYLYHVDLYRAESEKDVEGLGLLEIMQDPENVVLIEWPEKIESFLPKDAKHLYFTYLGDDRREIKIV